MEAFGAFTRNLETISQLNAALQALPSRSRQIPTPRRPYTPVAAVSFVTSRRRRLVAGLVPRTVGLVLAELCRHQPLL